MLHRLSPFFLPLCTLSVSTGDIYEDGPVRVAQRLHGHRSLS